MVRYSSWVLARCSSCNRLHSLFAWAKSGRWLSGCWGPSALIVRIQCFEFWILSAFVATWRCFSKAILSYNIMCFSLHPMAYNEFLYDSLVYHRESIVGWRPCFLLTGLCQHLFRLVVHSLSFRRSVLGSTIVVLLNHISRDCGDVTLFLVELCWTSAKISFLFHSCNGLYLFPSRHCSEDIAVWKNFRKVRRSRCC